jgi:hypothetical protein
MGSIKKEQKDYKFNVRKFGMDFLRIIDEVCNT